MKNERKEKSRQRNSLKQRAKVWYWAGPLNNGCEKSLCGVGWNSRYKRCIGFAMPSQGVTAHPSIKWARPMLVNLTVSVVLLSVRPYEHAWPMHRITGPPPHQGTIPQVLILAYLVPVKKEARLKDTWSPQGPALWLRVECEDYL
jgi:hypothetical protein